MPGYSTNELLSAQVTLARISRKAIPGTALQQRFGWNIGAGPVMGAMMAPGIDNDNVGPDTPRGNTIRHPGREGAYDYYDNVRRVGRASIPGTAATFVKKRPVGRVHFTIPRLAEKIDIPHEEATNRRVIGGPSSLYDMGGINYIRNQQVSLMQAAANCVEFQTAAMLRGKYYFNQVGDQLYQSFTELAGNSVQINYNIPSGNFNQLNLDGSGSIIDASWADPNADIPGHCYEINEKMLNINGLGVEEVMVSSQVWRKVQNNTAVKAIAGTYNPFDQVRIGPGAFSAKLKGMDWLTWHVIDYGLEVYDSATETEKWERVIEENHAVFIPSVNSSWVHYVKGGEYITEGPAGRPAFRYGYYAHAHPIPDPSGVRSFSYLNGFPSLPVPSAIVNGTVVFGG